MPQLRSKVNRGDRVMFAIADVCGYRTAYQSTVQFGLKVQFRFTRECSQITHESVIVIHYNWFIKISLFLI